MVMVLMCTVAAECLGSNWLTSLERHLWPNWVLRTRMYALFRNGQCGPYMGETLILRYNSLSTWCQSKSWTFIGQHDILHWESLQWESLLRSVSWTRGFLKTDSLCKEETAGRRQQGGYAMTRAYLKGQDLGQKDQDPVEKPAGI